MKKLIISSLLALASLSSFGQAKKIHSDTLDITIGSKVYVFNNEDTKILIEALQSSDVPYKNVVYIIDKMSLFYNDTTVKYYRYGKKL